MKIYEIERNEAGQRLDKYLQKRLSKAGISFLYKMLRKKNITLNGKKATGKEIVQEKDKITMYLSDETIEKFSNSGKAEIDFAKYSGVQSNKLQVLYEDNDYIAVNKPAGILSQKAKMSDVSANEMIISYLIQNKSLSEAEFATFKPSIANRLDRNTSGILIAGKSLTGLQKLSSLLKDRTILKLYHCVVVGEMNGVGGYIEGYLTKNEKTNQVSISKERTENGVHIETEYRPLQINNGNTLLEVHLITGKTHQIRAHLASIGYPILGDPKYGNPQANQKAYKKFGITGQLLHAYQLTLPNGPTIIAEEPEVFRRVME